ncbi:hypothetical protein RRG08_052232 [Elysia crispata]|uniref:Uncharacterized protein n=1 Tax=Elysia crispata TaxID=231223 RepID=A0AAE1D0N1_9GAST|nr:hypothetical protein RRG08_052232 [Elysia crispata]
MRASLIFLNFNRLYFVSLLLLAECPRSTFTLPAASKVADRCGNLLRIIEQLKAYGHVFTEFVGYKNYSRPTEAGKF